jgi:hypothetical protein
MINPIKNHVKSIYLKALSSGVRENLWNFDHASLSWKHWGDVSKHIVTFYEFRRQLNLWDSNYNCNTPFSPAYLGLHGNIVSQWHKLTESSLFPCFYWELVILLPLEWGSCACVYAFWTLCKNYSVFAVRRLACVCRNHNICICCHRTH